MSDITAIPYRTPACDAHLPDNDSDECPWCRIESLESTIKILDAEVDSYVDSNTLLKSRIEALEALVRNSTFEYASNWDLYDSVCEAQQPVDYAKPDS